MALIIEDGTGVTDANSFVSVGDATTFYNDRAFDAPAIGFEAALLQAVDTLATMNFCGTKASDANQLPFPRADAYDADGVVYPETVVPYAVKQAQLWLSYYIAQGNNPAAMAQPAVKRRKVGPLEREFAVGDYSMARTLVRDLPNAYAHLRHLLKPISVGGGRVARA